MFLDIGIGILLAVFTTNIFDAGLSFYWVIFAIVFSLLPDIDVITYGLRKCIVNKQMYNHRSLTHYPIIYLPITYSIYYFFGFNYSLLFFLCIYSHLIHDTFWLGWGISWLWPFSTKKFKLFPDRNGKISSQIVMLWDKEEEEELFTKYHNPNWIRDFYFRPNIVACVEYTVFIIAIIILLNSF